MRTTIPSLLLGWSLSVACVSDPKVIPAGAPLTQIEVVGGQAMVGLAEGVSARSIVGDLFADFDPTLTPDKAEARFGKPKEVVKDREDLTLFVYERQGKRVAVAQQTVYPSYGGGPPGTSFHIQAFPPESFVQTLPEPLRQVIQSEPQLREVHLGSGKPGDWNIHLNVRDGRVSYVSANEPPPPEVLGQSSADPSPPASSASSR